MEDALRGPPLLRKQHWRTFLVLNTGCGEPAVPIHRFLREASFSPEEVNRLTSAFDAALQLLRLKDRADPICELVAAKIIQVYRTGERDPAKLCARTIKELGIPMPG